MNANRVPGIGPSDPDKTQVNRQLQREAAQRVEKVGEVDPDEQARQQKWRQLMQSDDSANEESAADSIPLPSPFDLSSARQETPDFGMDEIPSSSYSPPPNLSPSSQDTMSDEDLPQSDEFWRSTDLPDQPIEKPALQEKEAKRTSSPNRGEENLSILGPPGKPSSKKSEEKKTLKRNLGENDEPQITQHTSPHKPRKNTLDSSKIAEEESPFTPKIKKQDRFPSQTAQKKAKGEDEEAPEARYWTPDLQPSDTRGSFVPDKKESKGIKGKAEEKELPEEVQKRRTRLAEEFSPHLKKAQKKLEEEKKREGQTILSPTIPELPTTIQPTAIAATQAASPYLRPETMPLFYQMVGSILIMSTPPGISRTEFVLNNPAFAGSKFFGATVELIRYSTAPDSFNIRLSGSNEAVAAFNQNIPNLMAAFQTGHFSFRIGRIDAEYAAHKPLVRRKEQDSGNDSKQDRQQQ